MRLSLDFSNSPYDCEVIIKDTSDIHNYVVNVSDKQSDLLEINVESSRFELTLIPKMPDYKSAFSDMEIQNLKIDLLKRSEIHCVQYSIKCFFAWDARISYRIQRMITLFV